MHYLALVGASLAHGHVSLYFIESEWSLMNPATRGSSSGQTSRGHRSDSETSVTTTVVTTIIGNLLVTSFSATNRMIYTDHKTTITVNINKVSMKHKILYTCKYMTTIKL